jgi:hypothetical protein
MRKLFNAFLFAILAVSFLVPSPPTQHAQAAADLPGLSVSGTQIMAGTKPIRLRGVNMGDPFWARNPDWYPILSPNDYLILSKNWKANIVRISVFPTQWKHMNHTALLDQLQTEINYALSNRLYVIISYHVIGWPDGYYQPANPGNPADTYDSSMTVATSFWAAAAQRFGSDKRIIFDLWNEPVHEDDFTLYGSDPNPLWAPLKGYYEQLIQTVRNNGAQNIIIATGNRWASWLVGIKDNPLSDPNLIYAYHKYSIEGSNSPIEWNRDTGGLIGFKPVIVSEWGYEDADAGPNAYWKGTEASYGTPFSLWLENNKLSNLVWMYHYDWTPALIKSNGATTLYGTFAKKYISFYNTPNWFTNGDMEKGMTGWKAQGIVTITPNTNQHYLGARSLFVSARNSSLATLARNITTPVSNGLTYHSFIWVKIPSGSANFLITLKLERTGASPVLIKTPATAVTGGKWTRIGGALNLVWTGTLTKVTWYIETPGSSTNYYADNATFGR